ncbi:FAD:protein FMN transferase [Desulfosporosinus hippei]|nr:FAD:protein FMN transferase [Desulfosporosinus hippei]
MYQETDFLFDTEVFIEAHGPGAQEAGLIAMGKMRALDRACNIYSPDSEVTALNQAAGEKPVPLSSDTFHLIQRSLEAGKLTNGIFDPTIGPLVKLWQEAKSKETLPTSEEIQKVLTLVDYKKVILNPDLKTAFLPTVGMSIDLGGIAKGYAVEQGINSLKQAGISSAMVVAGGNIGTINTKPDGTPWRVGIKDPQKPDCIIGYMEPRNQVVDTSGNYERFFTQEGKKYGHVLNPRTGRPTDRFASCTILTDSPTMADVLSTTLLILGTEGLILINDLPNTQALLIDSDGLQFMSDGLKGFIKFTLF